MKPIEFIQKHKYELAVILLFILAWSLRANVDGLPLTHPGNIKAADPMYHTLAAQVIVDEGRYGYLPYYLAQGHHNLIDPNPPLNYLTTAALTKISGLPVWVVMYLLVTLFEAFGVILLYLLCSKIFKSQAIGLLAAAAYVIPFGVQDWWYAMYIGLWNNVGGFFFFYASLWLAYEYWEKPSRWNIFALSLTVAGTWLIHVAELFITAFAVGFVVLRVLWKVPQIKEKVMHLLLLGGVPLISFILFYPRYKELSGFLTAGGGAEQSFIGWYAPQLPGLPFYTSLTHFPWWVLIVAGLGVLQIALNWRKYLPFIASEIYLFAHLFVLPWFLSAYYFFVRQRMSLPFIIAPLIAYALYAFLVKPLTQNTKASEWALVALVAVLLIGAGWYGSSAHPGYQSVAGLKGQEHLSIDKYDAMLWIQQNTPANAEIVFITGYYQMAGSYAKRVGFVLDLPDAIPVFQSFAAANGSVINLTLPWLGSNGDTEMGGSAVDTGSFFNYDRIVKRRGIMDVRDFDYALLTNFQLGNTQITQAYNQRMAETLSSLGWKPVYAKGDTLIFRNPEAPHAS